MSLATCQSCETIIDTDEDPEACVGDDFMCEVCREQAQEAEHEKVLSATDMKEKTWKCFCGRDYPDYASALRDLTAENQRYKEALEFYADKDNYKSGIIFEFGKLENNTEYVDEGNIARQALSKEINP